MEEGGGAVEEVAGGRGRIRQRWERKEPAAVGRPAVGEEGAGNGGRRRRWRGGAGRVETRRGENIGSTYQRVLCLLREWFDILKMVGIDYKTNSLFLA